LVLFIFTVIVYEGSYFGYFYIERKILKCWVKKHSHKHLKSVY
jgi:hypothetical protein